MKGVAIFAIAALIFTFLVIFFLSTVFLFRYRITLTTNYEYNFNNVQLALLTLLSSTHENQTLSEMIANHISFNQPLDNSIIQEKLDKMIVSNCYTFNATSFLIEGNDTNCNKKYKASVKMPYPYNPQNLTGDIILEMGG